jgi:hypothetical protein
MRRPPVNTWGIVVPPEIHVIIVTLTTLLVGIVTIVVAIVATVTGTATIMEETEIGATVEAPLLRVVADTRLTIGVVGATLAAHPLEVAAQHLVAEGVVVPVVAQETTTRPPQQALLQLKHLLLSTRGGKDLTPSALADFSRCRALAWIGSSVLSCGMWFLCLSCSIFLFFVLFFLVLFCFSFYLTISLYVLSLRWPWSLSWACKMCKAKICVEEKSFYIQIIMKNNGIEEASGAQLS